MTGTIGKSYDPLQISENFWFCKSADSQGIQVSSLATQANFDQLSDLEYFQKKLLRSLNIPVARFFGEASNLNNQGDEAGITAEELNFAKFIMAQQRRFAFGLTNGAITHLKHTGLWDTYRLTRNMVKVLINPPIEYTAFRRQKLLENKITMLKTVLGDEVVSKLFSTEIALETFMGWDRDTIEKNRILKKNEMMAQAQLDYLIQKIGESGTVDFKTDEEGAKTFAQTLQSGLDSVPGAPASSADESGADTGEEDEFSSAGSDEDFGGGDFGGGGEDFGGGGDMGGGDMGGSAEAGGEESV
jgi:hypothetical protein